MEGITIGVTLKIKSCPKLVVLGHWAIMVMNGHVTYVTNCALSLNDQSKRPTVTNP